MGERAWAAAREAAPAAGLLAAVLLLDRAPERGVLWWATTLVAVITVGLRDQWPLTMLVVCTLSVAAHVLQGRPVGIVDGCLFIVLYAVSVHRPRRVSAAALAGLLLVLACWSGVYAPRGRGTALASENSPAPSPSRPSAGGSAGSCTTSWRTACRSS